MLRNATLVMAAGLLAPACGAFSPAAAGEGAKLAPNTWGRGNIDFKKTLKTYLV